MLKFLILTMPIFESHFLSRKYKRGESLNQSNEYSNSTPLSEVPILKLKNDTLDQRLQRKSNVHSGLVIGPL